MKRRDKRRDPRRCAGTLTVSGVGGLHEVVNLFLPVPRTREVSTIEAESNSIRVHLLLKKKLLL